MHHLHRSRNPPGPQLALYLLVLYYKYECIKEPNFNLLGASAATLIRSSTPRPDQGTAHVQGHGPRGHRQTGTSRADTSPSIRTDRLEKKSSGIALENSKKVAPHTGKHYGILLTSCSCTILMLLYRYLAIFFESQHMLMPHDHVVCLLFCLH